jgi:MFS family permease
MTGLGQAFLRAVPRVLKAGIILGAGMSAVYGEFIPRSGGRPSRIDAYTISILLAVGVTLLLMFSAPLERWKARFRWLAFVSSLGIAPGFFLAMVAGPWLGEVSYASFRSFFFSPQTGEWSFGAGNVFFLPDFAGLLSGFSLFGHGLPDVAMYANALPLALAAYVIGFGDIITGTAIVRDAAAERPDEVVPIDERRTHLSVGLRNLGVALTGGPFFPLQGPLWTGATVVVTERYRRGRQGMDSLFGGIFSYYFFGIPFFFFIAPLLELFRPVLDIAFSLTLILTGFACAFVALSMPQGRVERGMIVLIGMLIMYFSTLVGLVAGFLLAAALLGKEAWREPHPANAAN